MARFFLIIAAISGFLAVVIGAFSTHGMKDFLSPAAIETVKTAVQYQFHHTAALLVVGLWLLHKPATSGLKGSGLAFILGSLLFSGSLYALALGAPRWLGPVTPMGGLCFLAGWALLIKAAWRLQPNI